MSLTRTHTTSTAPELSAVTSPGSSGNGATANSAYNNARAFAAAAISDMLSAIGSGTSEARLRLTSEANTNRFLWVIMARIPSPAGDTSGDTEHVWAHTNDGDLFIGTPMSLSVSAPLSQVLSLAASITNYLDGELTGYGKVHALLQSVNLDGSHNPNYIGDSESGYGSLTQQAAHNVP